MSIKQAKTEAELVATVANLQDAGACLIFAERAKAAGMPALVAACEERAAVLKPPRSVKRGSRAPRAPMKTHIVAEQALAMMIEEYNAGLPPTTYGELARRCGFEGQQNARWFGQVTDLIDAACALAGIPSFALVRVREANGDINNDAWRHTNYSHLRDQIISSALVGRWEDEDFKKLRDALAIFSANGLGNKKAWDYVWGQISMEAWARGSL